MTTEIVVRRCRKRAAPDPFHGLRGVLYKECYMRQ
jgi:hypothetical protein